MKVINFCNGMWNSSIPLIYIPFSRIEKDCESLEFRNELYPVHSVTKNYIDNFGKLGFWMDLSTKHVDNFGIVSLADIVINTYGEIIKNRFDSLDNTRHLNSLVYINKLLSY